MKQDPGSPQGTLTLLEEMRECLVENAMSIIIVLNMGGPEERREALDLLLMAGWTPIDLVEAFLEI